MSSGSISDCFCLDHTQKMDVNGGTNGQKGKKKNANDSLADFFASTVTLKSKICRVMYKCRVN